MGGAVPRRERVKARETLDLVKSMMVIGWFKSIKDYRVNEWMLEQREGVYAKKQSNE